MKFRKKHRNCRRGHEFTPENTREQIVKSGRNLVVVRVCRECRRMRDRLRYQKQKEEDAARS